MKRFPAIVAITVVAIGVFGCVDRSGWRDRDAIEQKITRVKNITIAESGTVFINDGSVGDETYELPEAGDAIGQHYIFCVLTAQNMTINPDTVNDNDQIVGLTNGVGDAIQSNDPGDMVELTAIDDTSWHVTAYYSPNGWADIN